MNKIPETIGPYRILGPLGRGGMGVVFRGEHVRSGLSVAVKTVRVPRRGQLACIRREIRALARVHHPDVVRIVDHGQHGGLPWYAMELLEGTTLRRYTKKILEDEPTDFLPPAEAVALGPAKEKSPQPGEWWTDVLGSDGVDGSALLGTSEILEHFREEAPGPEPKPSSSALFQASSDLLDSADYENLIPPAVPEERRLPAAGDHLEHLLLLVRRLCSPLAFLHGEGIVHGDLKPENILVRKNGTIVLVDFGLIHQFSGPRGREALEVSDSLVGTVAYMSPEQIRQDVVDARADLYALGCILYELVTGERPFRGPSVKEIMRAHLYVPPRSPSELVEALPAALETLILRLLEKEPSKRLGHAHDVATILESLGVTCPPSGDRPRPRAYLYRPSLAGRSTALRRLGAELARTRQGRGGVLIIEGESGVGKTRLVMTLAQKARRKKLRVLSGECHPSAASGGRTLRSSSPPLQAFARPLRAIADRCLELGPAATRKLLGRRGKVLALYEQSFASLPGLEEFPSPPELPAEAAQVRLFTYLVETFHRIAYDQPLLLALDDLQWADDLSLEFLHHLAKTNDLADKPVLLIGTCRSEELDDSLVTLLETPGIRRLHLRHLDERAIGNMVGDMLAINPPPAEFVRYLARQSGGNPFFVAEYLHAAVDEGLLFRDTSGRWQVAQERDQRATLAVYAALPLPRSLKDLIGRRLQQLSERPARLLEFAAAVGREIETNLLGRITRFSRPELDEIMDELIQRQLLEESSPEHFRFVHDQIREATYLRIANATRKKLHYRIATTLEEAYGTVIEQHHAALALHWNQAGETQRALPHYLAAAREAVVRNALGEAERLYRAYLALAPSESRSTIDGHLELALKVLRLRGRTRHAFDELAKALEAAVLLGDIPGEGEVYQGLTGLALDTGQFRKSRQFCARALEIHRSLGNRKQEGIDLKNLAAIYWHRSKLEKARRISQAALQIQRGIGDKKSEGATLNNLAGIEWALGRPEWACTLFEESLTIHRKLGDRRGEATCLNNVASIHFSQGQFYPARHSYELALRLNREVGDRRSEGVVLSNLGELQLGLGHTPQAERLFDRALELHRQTGDKFAEASTLARLAALYRAKHEDYPHARLLINKAEKIFDELGNPIGQAEVLCERGYLEIAEGRDSSGLLIRAEKLAKEAKVGPRSELSTNIEKLRQAIEGFKAR